MIVSPTQLNKLSLPDRVEWLEKLMYLIMKDVVFLSTYNQEEDKHDGFVHPFILCSDTFVYACADGEELCVDDIDTITDAFEKFGWDGLIAMVAAKRNVKPLKELRTDEYYSALRYLNLNDEDYRDYYAD
jgi:hypothetical protein